MGKLFGSLFYIPKYGKISDKILFSRLSLHILVILLSMAAMGFSAFAYFSCSVASNTSMIRAANFDAQITITDPSGTETVLTQQGGQFQVQLTGNTRYKVTIKANGSAQTGFVVITIGDTAYHTQQLGTVEGAEVSTIEFFLALSDEETVVFKPHWGTSSYYSSSEEGIEGSAYYITEDNNTIEIA